jgi:integrase
LISDMPRPRPPHLQREKNRHGKTVWFVRIGKGPRTRIRAAFGTPEFDAEYVAAVTNEPVRRMPERILTTSLQWLWDSYRETGAWAELSVATRRQRENIVLHVLKDAGPKPYAAIKFSHIQEGIDRRSRTPAQARNFLDAMKGLFRWAKKRGHIKDDPTAGDIELPKRKKGKGFPAWTREDVAAYQQKFPLGTRQRVWLDVLLYTGPRRGDAAIIGRQHELDIPNEDGSVSRAVQFKTEKSGELVTVTIPILPVLRRTLDAGPTGDLTWICSAHGRPFTKESFGNAFSEAARQAGIKKSAHGVRKIAATIAAENGTTENELDAIFGWVDGGRTSRIYTREANRARLSVRAVHKMDESGTSPPAPLVKVRAAGEKD